MRPRPAVALACVIVAALGRPAGAQNDAPDVDAAQAEAIRTLFTVTRTSDLFMIHVGGTMAALGQMAGMPPGFQEAFMERVEDGMPELMEALVPIYAAQLTIEEIEHLIAFYRTPTGQRFVAVQPQLTRESMQLGQHWSMRLVSEVLANLATAEAPAAEPAPAAPRACDLGVEQNLAMSTRLQPRHGGDGNEIWMQNHSDCTLRVTSVFLYECENIRNPCNTSTRRNIDVRPGEDRLVMTVTIRYRDTRSSFRYRYQWEQVP